MRHAAPFLLLMLAACQTSAPRVTQSAARSEAKSSTTPLSTPQYTAQFRDLPLVASLSRLPWTSDAWTSAHGGASFRWQLAAQSDADETEDLAPYIQYPLGQVTDVNKISPSEKLDLYLGNKDWKMTKEERQRTLEQKNHDGSKRIAIPEWEGIMHAWSIASLQFEPVGPITLPTPAGKTVTFESQDIYSLLSLFVHEQGPKPQVLASLCNPEKDELTAASGPYAFENSKQAFRRKNCSKIDPAQFHIVLANQIGKLNEGFVIDRDHQGEISNNPVVAYESRIIEDSKRAVRPDGSRTVHMKTILFLTAETSALEMDAAEERYPYDSESYNYELDVDAKGAITGGRWLTVDAEANASIPDFMWKASPVWLNGPIKTIYEKARSSYVAQQERVRNRERQLRPLEDMPQDERQSLNSYFNSAVPKPRVN